MRAKCVLCSNFYWNIVQHLQHHGFNSDEAFLASYFEFDDTFETLEERISSTHRSALKRFKAIENPQSVFNGLQGKIAMLKNSNLINFKSHKTLSVVKYNREEASSSANALFSDSIWVSIVKGLINDKDCERGEDKTFDVIRAHKMKEIMEEAEEKKHKLNLLLVEYEENEIKRIKTKIAQSEFDLENECIEKRQNLEKELKRKSEDFINRLNREEREHMTRFKKQIKRKRDEIFETLQEELEAAKEIKKENVSVWDDYRNENQGPSRLALTRRNRPEINRLLL